MRVDSGSGQIVHLMIPPGLWSLWAHGCGVAGMFLLPLLRIGGPLSARLCFCFSLFFCGWARTKILAVRRGTMSSTPPLCLPLGASVVACVCYSSSASFPQDLSCICVSRIVTVVSRNTPPCCYSLAGMATSQDGLAWQKKGPVFDGGAAGAFDERGAGRRRIVMHNG